MLRRGLQRDALNHRLICRPAMWASISAFGVGSPQLLCLTPMNGDQWLSRRWTAMLDGGLRQPAELLLSGYLAMAANVVFKTCVFRLISNANMNLSSRRGSIRPTYWSLPSCRR